jgi:hypothetical protein
MPVGVPHACVDTLGGGTSPQIDNDRSEQVSRRILFVDGDEREHDCIVSDFRLLLKSEKLQIARAELRLVPRLDHANRQGREAQGGCRNTLKKHEWMMARLLDEQESMFLFEPRQSFAKCQCGRTRVFEAAKMSRMEPRHCLLLP